MMRDAMLELIQRYDLIPPGSTVVCGVSGGADSIYLLYRLCQLRRELSFSLAVAHYDHGLRGEASEKDGLFVREFLRSCQETLEQGECQETVRSIPFFLERGDVAQQAAKRRQGVEETARMLRYGFLRQVAEQLGGALIATAHHANDNLETMLLNLARGAGLRGLCGIAPKSNGVIRPLLSTTKEEIVDFLRAHHLPWREDESNESLIYRRNWMRHQVLPGIQAIYPKVVNQSIQTMGRIREDEAYLTQQAQRALGEVTVGTRGELSIPASRLAQLPSPLAIRAARILIGKANGGDDRCQSSHLEGLVELCMQNGPSAQVQLPMGLCGYRVYDRLVLSYRTPKLIQPCWLPEQGEVTVGDWTIQCQQVLYAGERQTGYEMYLSQKQAPRLWIRTRQRGDYLELARRPRKTVKKWMIEGRIPAHCRDFLPILVGDRGGVAAVPLLGPAVDFLPVPGERAWHLEFSSLWDGALAALGLEEDGP